MENLSLFLFISIAVPLGMMLLIFKGRGRKVLFFLILGMFVALFSGELNGLINAAATNMTERYYCVNVSPATEELLKAVPIFMFVFMWKPNSQTLMECAVAVGVGFATLENAVVLALASGSIDFQSALIRGFGAGIMHGLASLIIGWGLAVIMPVKKLVVSGSIALISLSAIFHSVYNALALSRYQIAGLLLPVSVFIPFLVFGIKMKRNKRSTATSSEK